MKTENQYGSIEFSSQWLICHKLYGLDYFKKPEQQKAYEVKKNYLKNGEGECQKERHNSKNKKRFVVDCGKKAFGNKD